MYCAPCRSERLGHAEWCAVCGAGMVHRSDAELETELAHVVWVLAEVPLWDASLVSAAAKALIAGRYRQQERILRRALVGEPPSPLRGS